MGATSRRSGEASTLAGSIVAALIFLLALSPAAPVAASTSDVEIWCSTCEPCQQVSCFSCAFYVQDAVLGCCNTENGDASCNGSSQFEVTCDAPPDWSCICDENGQN